MMIRFSIKQQFKVSAEILYAAWLNSAQHSAMTGGEARITDYMYKSFSAWDGYISGTTTHLVKYKKIVQRWWTTEFKEQDKSSKITITFENNSDGCLLTLEHTNIPKGQSDYEKGWQEHYFTPMIEYFNN
jgi:activator of HSP90 ATPase